MVSTIACTDPRTFFAFNDTDKQVRDRVRVKVGVRVTSGAVVTVRVRLRG